MSEMINFAEENWKATLSVSKGAILLDESPILSCPANVPQGWKKLGKKIAKLEPDMKPDDCPDTLPPWNLVRLNEAIIRLLYGFDACTGAVKKSILELYTEKDICVDSPFESLVNKAKIQILKDAPKIGISKSTCSNLSQILRILTTKICVTTDGGAVLFHKLGSIQHSCMPNCMFIPRGSRGQLIAIRDIAAGELISCSHIPTNCLRSSVDSRQSWLRGVSGTRCRSECCTSGFDVRRRVICPHCSNGLCHASYSLTTSKWIGEQCQEEVHPDMEKEKSLMKKIMFLNEADIDVSRLFQFTQSAILDAEKSLGKAHFCYQQLLLLQCGLALHSLCSSASVSRRSFACWVQMLVDIYNFSLETKLPFEGMDELVQIILAPGTLKMAVNLIGSFPHYTDIMSAAAVATFSLFVEQACECLFLIEGPNSSHTQDGLKLKNWWLKKFAAWKLAEPVQEPILTVEADLVKEENKAETVQAVPASRVSHMKTYLSLGLVATGVLVWLTRRRS